MGPRHALMRVRVASQLASTRLPHALNCSPAASAGPRKFHSSPHLSEEKSFLSELASEVLPSTTLKDNKASDIAFAFDIDGVLYRGKEPIKGAAHALRSIRDQGHRYVFLTNGGGNHDDLKAKSLRNTLGLEPHEDVVGPQVIQSHTPMKGWPTHIKENDTVLVTGQAPHFVRKVAQQYGFKNVLTPADLAAAKSNIYPFLPSLWRMPSWMNFWENELPRGKTPFVPNDPSTTDVPKSALKIDHIFVWNDPRDWSLDIQIIHDALVSHQGYIGTFSSKNGDKSLPNNGWQQDGQPNLWISNLDLFWKTSYPINRFGTGAFVEALKAVWSAATNGSELQYKALGKPLQATYEFAQQKLRGMDASGREATDTVPLKRVYMIGDNPESDIRGANDFKPEDGTEWVSILVRTGVWAPTPSEPEPRHKPNVIVDDVVDAIVWALNNEGIKMSRQELLDLGQAREERLQAKEPVTMPAAPVGRIVA